MSVISNIIFNNKNHYITSSFGSRTTILTSKGTTAKFHQGTDYGTNNIKLAQYAVENGYVFEAAKDASDGANYVWVIYPRIKLAMLHYHLDSYKVKKGQSVSRGTLLGYTGKTGRATGIHLHLAVRNLSKLSDSQIKSMSWSNLNSCPYIDPEKISYSAVSVDDGSSFLPSKGYFAKGDVSPDVGKIASFMRRVFPDYTDKKALGNNFGPYMLSSIKEFQKRTGLNADGYIGTETLEKLKSYGFTE